VKHPAPPQTDPLDRELSRLAFDERVLGEALRPRNPPFERMKFLSIAASNLDEFFRVRVGTPRKKQALSDAVITRAHALTDAIYKIWNETMIPLLAEHGIRLTTWDALGEATRARLNAWYQKEVFPLLTPLCVDGAHPFPHLPCRALNWCVLLQGDSDKPHFSLLSLPDSLPRLIRPDDRQNTFIPTEEIVRAHFCELFCGRKIIASAPFRITRCADLPVSESGDDLLAEIEQSLNARKRGTPVRLEIASGADERILNDLMHFLGLTEADVYPVSGLLGLDALIREIDSLPDFDALRYVPHIPNALPRLSGQSLFDRISQKDILLCHPYDSFDPIIELVEEAARDERVLSVRQTLYRVSTHSALIDALLHAAQAGKQVTVLIELKARFDEENNIRQARRLEKAGAHVIYGAEYLKTHSKLLLIVRREDDGLRRYVHLGTGNYNEQTARAYTDYSYLTCREDIARDASLFFNLLTGQTAPPVLSRLCAAPHDLRSRFLDLIEREARHAARGRPAFITAKMNALTDEEIIRALYDASRAGVCIRLIVRGMCTLRPRIKGLSEHIRVRSIVGRFLEHGRIYYFHNGGNEELYLSSADWMPRNLDRRIELMFPITEESLRRRLLSHLRIQWADDVCAHELLPDGTYCPPAGTKLSAQEQFMSRADLLI